MFKVNIKTFIYIFMQLACITNQSSEKRTYELIIKTNIVCVFLVYSCFIIR